MRLPSELTLLRNGRRNTSSQELLDNCTPDYHILVGCSPWIASVWIVFTPRREHGEYDACLPPGDGVSRRERTVDVGI